MSSERQPGSKRIHRSKDKAQIIEEVMSIHPSLFRDIWRVLLFAAAVGHSQNARSSLESVDQGKGIDQATFGNCPSWPGFLYLLSLCETQSEECLRSDSDSEDMRIKVFEEYANGGLSLIQSRFRSSGASMNSILDLLELASPESEEVKADLDFQIG